MEFDDESELGLDITQEELMSILPVAVLQRLAPEPSGKWHISRVRPNEFRAEYLVKRSRDRIIVARHTISTVLSVAEVHNSFPVHRARSLDQAQTDAILPQIEHLVHQRSGDAEFISRTDSCSSAREFQEDKVSGFSSATTTDQADYFTHSQSSQMVNAQELPCTDELPSHHDVNFFDQNDFTTTQMPSNSTIIHSGNSLANHAQRSDAMFTPNFSGANTILASQTLGSTENILSETDFTEIGLQWDANEAIVSPAPQNTSAAVLQSIEFSQAFLSGNPITNPFSERVAQFPTSALSPPSRSANHASLSGIPFTFHVENITTALDGAGKKNDTTEIADHSEMYGDI